jgi:uncharacterized membrane protein (DUF4010 family)
LPNPSTLSPSPSASDDEPALLSIREKLVGHAGFYVVSVLGGFVASASAVALGATLAAHGQVTPLLAAVGAVLASLASAAVNMVVVARVTGNRQLNLRLAAGMGLVGSLEVLGVVMPARLHALGG